MAIFFYFILFLINYFSLKFYIKIAIKNEIIAIGNSKNLHFGKIPRGAGLVFGSIYIISVTFTYFQKNISFENFFPIFIGSILSLILGFWDDIKDLGISIKLFGQFFIIITLVYLIYDFSIFNQNYFFDLIFNILLILVIMWMLNAYNFLDGSDGHLGTVASMQCLLLAIATHINGQLDIVWPIFLLLSVIMIFLKFNWEPASVFMGDSGSLFIGINIITFILISFKFSILNPITMFIILSYFLIDTFGTLILRIFMRKSWKQRHRSHPYQNFSRIFSHQKTSILVIIYHLFWLLPLVTFTIYYPNYKIIFLMFSMFPTLLFLFKYGPLFSSD